MYVIWLSYSSFFPSVAPAAGLGASGLDGQGAMVAGLEHPLCSELVPNLEIP